MTEFRLIEHGAVDSTNERAFESLARGEARDGDVHVAPAQSAGRGRRGARWHSAPGEGLYMSVVLLPPPPAPHPASLTMAAGLAVFDAVRELGLDAQLKWPNDVFVRGAKLAGVLVETRGFDAARPHYVVGIGVNVAQREFPRELSSERAVTSLALEGVAVEVADLRTRLLHALAERLRGTRGAADALAQAFLAATRLAGARARVETEEAEIAGTIAALSLARGLEVVRDDGRRVALQVEHVRAVRAL
jgi:BirA family biotin operon repressor/biotin-[acetyl-CoA-carboxylase] ligase